MGPFIVMVVPDFWILYCFELSVVGVMPKLFFEVMAFFCCFIKYNEIVNSTISEFNLPLARLEKPLSAV